MAREPADDGPGAIADILAETEAQLVAAQDDEPLPQLEAGFYLYSDVVLGLSATAGPLLAQLERRDAHSLDADGGPG